VKRITGNKDAVVTQIDIDSRNIIPGSLFTAVKGTVTDGHQYIGQAVKSGAAVIVCESLPSEAVENVTYVQVEDSTIALGTLARNFYDDPSSKLTLVGITGTNGKTTTVTLLHELFLASGHKAGLISTIQNKIGTRIEKSTHTTPDPVQLNRLLATMVAEGCEYCFMEVSSHAVDQKRIGGLTFAGGIFSNITHDHLDYHKTFDAYLKAKKGFFDGLPSSSFALINKDDRNGMVMVQNSSAAVHTYGLRSMAEFRCRIIENHLQGLELNIDGTDCWFKLVGTFNAYNLLAVYSTAILLGQEKQDVLAFLSKLEPVDGRFNAMTSDDGITAIVDYAHTPDALKNVLETIQQIRSHREKLITVVGAGGNRDALKRPVMAKIACDLSDRVILTSDNPRFEEPGQILEEMKKGIEKAEEKKVLVIEDRKEAIRAACALAGSGDIILVAGKGHETYQEIKGVRYPFDDKEILKEVLSIKESRV
jgi:UDP-N-acetylmuramoyl-L-alanyl-D-glutamate--2,6-diaminopimelate ligase